jgi:hypothetical protein
LTLRLDGRQTRRAAESILAVILMERDWWVYSTVLEGRAILVKDRLSGKRGSIDDPTPEEWSRAFYAPSCNYRWEDGSRVAEDAST